MNTHLNKKTEIELPTKPKTPKSKPTDPNLEPVTHKGVEKEAINDFVNEGNPTTAIPTVKPIELIEYI